MISKKGKQVNAIVSGNESNLLKPFQSELKFKRILCACHNIQLAIIDQYSQIWSYDMEYLHEVESFSWSVSSKSYIRGAVDYHIQENKICNMILTFD